VPSQPNAVRQFTDVHPGRQLRVRPTSGGFSQRRLDTAAPTAEPWSESSLLARTDRPMIAPIPGGRFPRTSPLTRRRRFGSSTGNLVSTCNLRRERPNHRFAADGRRVGSAAEVSAAVEAFNSVVRACARSSSGVR